MEIKKTYPKGTPVVLEKMDSEPGMYSGLKGTVEFVDDMGQIHVSWENGSSLALNADVDEFHIDQISVLLVEPNKTPKVVKISNTLKAMQRAVDGLIEVFPIFEDVLIVCNEEGKFNGMQPNRFVRSDDGTLIDIIFGPFFICCETEDGDFASISDKLIEKYKDKFKEPEMFYMDFDGRLVSY